MRVFTSRSSHSLELIHFLFLGIVFLLPFERIPSVQWHGFTIKLSYLCALLFLGVFFLKKPLKFLKEHPATLSDLFLTGFWGSGLLSIIFSPDHSRSLIIIALWAFVFLLYFIASRFFTQPLLVEKAEKLILFSTSLVCLFGIYQFLGDSLGLSPHLTGLRDEYTKTVFGFPRIQSVALEPLYFSNFLLLPFFLTVYTYLKTAHFFNKYFWLGTLILINIILGISRGAEWSLLIGSIFFFVYLFCQRQYYPLESKKIIGVIGMAVLAAIFSFLAIITLNGGTATTNYIDHAAVSDVHSGSSVPGRVDTYKLALHFFEQKPLLGIGVGGFGPLTVSSAQELKQYGYGIVNNEYLEILTETGVIGLLLFTLFGLSFLAELRKSWKKQPDKLKVMALLSGLLAILLQYNFFSTLYILYIWIFLAYLRSFSLKGKNQDT